MKGRDELGGIESVRSGALTFTLEETAQLAHVSMRSLAHEAKLGRLRIIRIGRFVRIPRAEVLRLVGLDGVEA
jgi:hypothetical protein